jgi:hypothetical protein
MIDLVHLNEATLLFPLNISIIFCSFRASQLPLPPSSPDHPSLFSVFIPIFLLMCNGNIFQPSFAPVSRGGLEVPREVWVVLGVSGGKEEVCFGLPGQVEDEG